MIPGARMANIGMIDLHVYTDASDSPLSAAMLINQARHRGIGWLAVTDHDTMASCEYVARYAVASGIRFIRGVEITASAHNGRVIHLLGYGIRKDFVDIVEGSLSNTRKVRTRACRDAVAALRRLGYDVEWQDVLNHARGTSVFKVHVMHALVDAGYTNKLKGQLDRELMASGGPHRAKSETVGAEGAIRLIHSAGGVAVLAHPGLFGAGSVLEDLTRHGLDGVEAYHPSHRRKTVDKILSLAQRLDLIVTGGSDFHGRYGEYEGLLGCSQLNPGHVRALLDRIQQRGRCRVAEWRPARSHGGTRLALMRGPQGQRKRCPGCARGREKHAAHKEEHCLDGAD